MPGGLVSDAVNKRMLRRRNQLLHLVGICCEDIRQVGLKLEVGEILRKFRV